MKPIVLKPRVGSRSFRLKRESLHCINLVRHGEYVKAIDYLKAIDLSDRVEVYGTALSWLSEHLGYREFKQFRDEVLDSDLTLIRRKQDES